jgi:hypothetical protein
MRLEGVKTRVEGMYSIILHTQFAAVFFAVHEVYLRPVYKLYVRSTQSVLGKRAQYIFKLHNSAQYQISTKFV